MRRYWGIVFIFYAHWILFKIDKNVYLGYCIFYFKIQKDSNLVICEVCELIFDTKNHRLIIQV